MKIFSLVVILPFLLRGPWAALSGVVAGPGGQGDSVAVADPANFGPGPMHKAIFDRSDRPQLDALIADDAVRDVEDYGSFALAILHEDDFASRQALRDSGLRFRDDLDQVQLSGGILDTMHPARSLARLIAPEMIGESLGKPLDEQAGLYLLQFRGPVRDQWREELESLSPRALLYRPSNSFIVALAPEQVEGLQQLATRNPAVQFVDEYQPGFRMTPAVRDAARAGLGGPQQVDILLVNRSGIRESIGSLEALASHSNGYHKNGSDIELGLAIDPVHLHGIARHPDVLSIALHDEADGAPNPQVDQAGPGALTTRADFSSDPSVGAAPVTVRFSDNSSTDVTAWWWDFGDGAASMERNPTHTYTTAGTYMVSLTVSGPNGTAIVTTPRPIRVGGTSALGAGLMDGSFELQIAAGAPMTPWSILLGSFHLIHPEGGVTSDNAMPVDGTQWCALNAEESLDTTPPSNPGGVTAPAVGGAGITQDFSYAAGLTFLEFDAAFISAEFADEPIFNDWMSVDVSDGSTTFNLYYRDTFSATPLTSVKFGLPMTTVDTTSIDLAAAFPSSTPATVFTLTAQVGNGYDFLQPSHGYLDHLRFSGDCDADGVPDSQEPDCDSDGTPDDCEPDCDSDGTPDDCEPDCDSDGTPDDCEVDCNSNGTPDDCESFTDCDSNGIPDECDPDCDSDGTPDACEPDCDSDGTPDDCEPDCDSDGTPDDCEVDCNSNGTPDDCESFADCDSNGIPDECDPDCDSDGTPDACEPDCDSDGTPDDCEPDCDSDGTPDDCEVDCNSNGTPDDCESFTDCDSNGIPDECDPDCDSDGTPDACEPDCDSDGTPDDCEPDCDSDGTPDDCEVDCNSNGTPDDCESITDCNTNGIPDECDISSGSSSDHDGDGTPDECQDAGVPYCIGAINTSGVGASILALGSSVVADNDLTLYAEDCPTNKFGLFFWGSTAIQAPFGEGFRCVGGSTRRLPPLRNTGALGVASLAVDLTFAPIAPFAIPGTTRHFQFWFRDGAGGPAGYNLSNGTSVTWQ